MLGKEAIHPGRSHHSTGGDVDAPQQFKLLPMTTLRVFRRRNVANAGVFFVTPRGLAEAQKRPGDARFLAPSQDAPPIQEVYITGLTRP